MPECRYHSGFFRQLIFTEATIVVVTLSLVVDPPAECPALTQPLSARGSGPFSDVELKTKSGSLIVSVPTVAYRRPKRSR